MTSWPILERELRVWARRRVTYWARFAIAAGAVLVCASMLLWSGPVLAPQATGRNVFDGLVSVAFLLSCMACVLTADAISSERREGTLGLLILTRVKRLDLLIGKLMSNGLASVLGLVALLPLLALALLTGGVSGGEVARKALALLNTLFLAMSIGLWASTCGVERFRTAFSSLLVLAGLVVGPRLLGVFLPGTRLSLASPLAAISQASGVTYANSATGYWISLSLVQVLSWGFLFVASLKLGRSLDEIKPNTSAKALAPPAREGTGRASSSVPRAWESVPDAASLTASTIPCPYCGRQNDAERTFCSECGTELRPKPVQRPGSWTLSTAPTPLHWLFCRQRGLKPLLWVAAFIGCCHVLVFQIIGRFSWMRMGTYVGIFPVSAMAEAAIEVTLFAWVASRFFVEARRTGELELLVTTPLGAESLFVTQWETLKRLARAPVLFMVGFPFILEGFIALSGGFSAVAYWKLYYLLSILLSAANTILSVGAIFSMAPWFGLHVAGQGRAIFWTVLLAKGLPYAVGSSWSLAYRSVLTSLGIQSSSWSGSLWILGFLVPHVTTLLIYCWLIRLARGQLLPSAGTEPLDISRIFSRSLARLASLVRRARRWNSA